MDDIGYLVGQEVTVQNHGGFSERGEVIAAFGDDMSITVALNDSSFTVPAKVVLDEMEVKHGFFVVVV